MQNLMMHEKLKDPPVSYTLTLKSKLQSREQSYKKEHLGTQKLTSQVVINYHASDTSWPIFNWVGEILKILLVYVNGEKQKQNLKEKAIYRYQYIIYP